MSNRPFIFRFHAAELFTEIQCKNIEEKAAFITQLSTDLLTLIPTFDYSKKIIEDTIQLIEIRSKNGRKGGRPKKQKKAKVKLNESKAKANPKQEEEKEVKEKYKKEIPLWLPEKDWQDFLIHRAKIKKPMTDLAQERMIKKLDSLRQVYDVTKLIDRAIRNEWQDIYLDDSCKIECNECTTPSWL